MDRRGAIKTVKLLSGVAHNWKCELLLNVHSGVGQPEHKKKKKKNLGKKCLCVCTSAGTPAASVAQ